MRACLGLLLSLSGAAASIDYAAVLVPLWNQTDANGDGVLSLTEFEVACGKLGISADIFTSHDQSISTLYTSLDTDSSSGLTPEELAAAIQKYPEYKEPLIAAFTNGAGEVPTEIPTASEEVQKAKAVITSVVVVAGKASEIYAGQREQITQAFADAADVSLESVIITFLTTVTEEAAAERRRLGRFHRRLAGETTTIEAKIFMPDQASADAAEALMPTDASDVQALPAFSGLEVTAFEVQAIPKWAPEYAEIVICAIGMTLACILVCVGARCWAAKQRRTEKAAYTGCCSNGCCSFLAVKIWASGELFACIFFVFCLGVMYARAAGLANVIDQLVGVFLQLSISEVPFLQEFQEQLPEGVVGTIEQYKHLIPQLPVALLIPGLLAVICLLSAALCPCGKCHVGRYGCTKCLIMLNNLLLIISFIFYTIFAVVAIILEFAPPRIQEPVDKVKSMCQVIPAEVNQLVADNLAAIQQLSATGQDISELSDKLGTIEALAGLVDTGCDCVLGIFTEFQMLFLPGALCMIACIFAIYINNALCCSAGCCKSNQKAIKDAEDKKAGGVQLSTISGTDAQYVAP